MLEVVYCTVVSVIFFVFLFETVKSSLLFDIYSI